MFNIVVYEPGAGVVFAECNCCCLLIENFSFSLFVSHTKQVAGRCAKGGSQMNGTINYMPPLWGCYLRVPFVALWLNLPRFASAIADIEAVDF